MNENIKIMKISELLMMLEQNMKTITDLQIENELIVKELRVRKAIGEQKGIDD